MKSFFFKFYHHTLLGNLLRYCIHKGKYYLDDKTFIQLRYRKRTGKVLSLKNPELLNEKINWLKINDRTPLHTKCADKYTVREYVAAKIGSQYLIPLYFQTKNPTEINPQNINDIPCIIKTNHDSGGGIILHDKKNIDWLRIQKELKNRLENNYYKKSREWQYKNIESRIIVEKLLLDKNGQIPMDYKVHCFNGKPEIIQIDLDRFSNHKRNLYDVSWNLLPFTWSTWENGKPLWDNGRPTPKPNNLDKLLELAKILSSDFSFARVDFYEVGQQIYFGEITYHPGSGFETIYPEKWDYELGKRLALPFND